MPTIHRAIFRQPGIELNPMLLKVPTPVTVEVFEIESKARPTGKWTAREATSKTVFKDVGTQLDPYQARYRVARLFRQQTGQWHVDDQAEACASGFHFHYETDGPSLCGSKFHCSESPRLALSLPEVRACRRTLVPIEWQHLCEICQRLVDRTPAPGDKIRVRLTADTGVIISEADPNLAPGKAQRYVTDIERGGHTPGSPSIFLASEITLCMFERDQPF